MPVVTFRAADLARLVGKPLSAAQMAESLPSIGGDVGSFDEREIAMEWFPNRPDLLAVEGTARALAAFLGLRPGLARYDVSPAQTELRVDPSVAAVRPHAALCFVRELTLDEDAVAGLIEAQEKLCLGMGRRRRKVAIGLHDASGVAGPFTYTTVAGGDKAFVPLGEERRMTPAQVAAEHPKGMEYAHLLPPGRFPVFLDASGEVLSMPPVINAARTAVTTRTTDILVDVTGTDAKAVRQTVALLASCLAERGGRIEAVTVHDASGTWSCPDLRPVERTLHIDDLNGILGTSLTGEQAARALERLGHGVQVFDNRLLIHSPAWRFDLLHDVDWIEDVAIGTGFEAMPTHGVQVPTFGGPLGHQRHEDRLRALLIGHGFLEARTLTLSDATSESGAWGAEAEPAVQLLNPVLQEQTQLRTRLLPSLLHVLAQNRHRSLPQRLFEVGHVVRRRADGSWGNQVRLAVVELSARAGFADAKAMAQALERDARVADGSVEATVPGFIPGRAGAVLRGGRQVGHFGELHPQTLSAFSLTAPGWAYECELQESGRASGTGKMTG